MRYLVTGGAGFIGSHLVESLLERGHTLSVIDNLISGKRENLPQAAALHVADCGDAAALAPLVNAADGVFHLAAIPSVQQSREQWAATHRTNLSAFITLLEAIKQRPGGQIPCVFASSAAVYGNPASLPVHEGLPLAPLTPYGSDKAGCELHALAARACFGLPVMGLRFFNVYGPRQDPHSPYSGVISIFAHALRHNQPITMFGDGLQTRDFIEVGDVVAALKGAMHRLHGLDAAGLRGLPLALNVGTGNAVSLLELARLLGEAIEQEPSIQHLPERSGDIRHSQASRRLMEEHLGALPITPLYEGLCRLLA